MIRFGFGGLDRLGMLQTIFGIRAEFFIELSEYKGSRSMQKNDVPLLLSQVHVHAFFYGDIFSHIYE